MLEAPEVAGRKRRQYGLTWFINTIEIGGFLRYFSGNIQDDEWLNSTKLLKLPGDASAAATSMVLQLAGPGSVQTP